MSLAFSAVSGLGSLWLVNAVGGLTGVLLPWNALAVLTAVAGGIPGVASLVVLRLLWGA